MFRWLLLVIAFALPPVTFAAGADFTLDGLDGRKHSLSDYRGKWVVVNYWATWCPPCREEMPELVSFHNKHKDKDAVVLGVNMEEGVQRDTLIGFSKAYGLTYPILISKADMTGLGPVSGLPTTYLVAPDGKVVAHKTGPVTAENIESFMKSHKAK